MPAKSKAQQRMMNARCRAGDKEMCKLAKEFNVSGTAFNKLPEKKKPSKSKRKKGATRG